MQTINFLSEVQTLHNINLRVLFLETYFVVL